MLNDIRVAVRGIRRTPGFALAAILTLALGIGANTAIFSVVDAVLLRSLPYPEPDRLVLLYETLPGNPATIPTSVLNYQDWRAQAKSFESMAAMEAWSAVISGPERSEEVRAVRATAELFSVLGVKPMLGRTFAAGEDKAGNHQVILLSHRMWQRSFGGDTSIVGRKVLLNTEPYTVIGVMPPGFEFPTFWMPDVQFWAPLPLDARPQSRDGRSLRILARLKAGTSIEQARAEMSGIATQLATAYPDTNAKWGASLQPLQEMTVRNVRLMLWVVMATVSMLLLIACVNVANLLLSRSAARRREIAVRAAIGAGPGRIARLVLAESCTLACCGGVLGIAIAVWGVQALQLFLARVGPQTLPRLDTVSVDGAVLAYSAAVSLLAGIGFGLAPAFRATRVDLTDDLKGATRSSASAVSSRLRKGLVVAEVALSLMLLAGAGLLVRSFARLAMVQPGFDARQVITMGVPYAGSRFGKPERRVELYREIVNRVAALPGVESASAINHIPIAGDDWHMGFRPEGNSYAPGEVPSALFRVVRPGYFRTMRIPLLHGRDISEQDDGAAPHVALITETTARRFWSTADAVGKRFRSDPDEPWITVVGVVGDVAQTSLGAPHDPEFYLPLPQSSLYTTNPMPFFYMTLVARVHGNPDAMVEPIRRAIRGIDTGLALTQVASMESVVSTSVWQQRLSMTLLALFAALALLLACVGVYGVVSYAVAQRTREFGVRAALGASPADLLRMALRESLGLTIAGVAIGTAGALALTRLMASLLYNTRPSDPLAFTAAALTLAVLAAVASAIPARRAMRIDPVSALRYE